MKTQKTAVSETTYYIKKWRGWSSYLLGVLVPLRVLKPKMTATRVVSVRFMTILSKSP